MYPKGYPKQKRDPNVSNVRNLPLCQFRKDLLVKAYLELREEKKQLMKDVAEINIKLDRMEAAFLEKMEMEGEDGFRANGQTVYKSTIQRVKVDDREAFFDYVFENRASGMLEARASKDGVLSWMELHPDEAVPGLVLTKHLNINVRKGV